ncbi:hypothetical protein CoNPh26_CDS0137 [Staphylococcus phage S-CoN_Ph26]|nr:hypothetical protein CoNPh26_CDS0137 [Staphylococcus phage S-CoN_Ph26]
MHVQKLSVGLITCRKFTKSVFTKQKVEWH